MFTGIVDHCGKISAIENNVDAKRLVIACEYDDIVMGESIAVDGVCLTAYHQAANSFTCDVSPETLAVTNLQFVQLGQLVNLERAVRINERLGGHIVTGHVDEYRVIREFKQHHDFVTLIIEGFSAVAQGYLVTKGCITVNGVNLTINQVTADTVALMLIPQTLQHTNLSVLQAGDRVNIEYDYIARIIEQQLKPYVSILK